MVRAGGTAQHLREFTTLAKDLSSDLQPLLYFIHSCKYLFLPKQKPTNIFPTKVTGSWWIVGKGLSSQHLHTEWNAKVPRNQFDVQNPARSIFLKMRRSFVMYANQPKIEDLKTLHGVT